MGLKFSSVHFINEVHHGIPQWINISPEVQLLVCFRQFSKAESIQSYLGEEKAQILPQLEKERVYSQTFLIPVKQEKIKISLLEVRKLKNTLNLIKLRDPLLEINTSPLGQINKFNESSKSTLLVDPLHKNIIKDGVFGDTFHIMEEIVLDLSLPLDTRLYPSLFCSLKDRLTGEPASKTNTLCVFELDLFEHYMEELIHQYDFLYSI